MVVVLLLGTLPLAIASIVLPLRVQSTLESAGHERLIQVSRDVATSINTEMQRHLDTVNSLARVEPLVHGILRHRDGSLDAPGLAAVNRQIGALLQGLAANQYQGLFLCDADGFLFAGVLRSGEATAYDHLDIRDRRYYEQARDTLKPVISDPMFSKVGNVPIVVVAVPVLDGGGEFSGLVGLAIELRPLSDAINRQKFGETGHPFVIDRQGLILTHPDPARVLSENIRDRPNAGRLADRMLRGETGIERSLIAGGTGELAAFSPVPVTGWSVGASIETAEFGIPAQRLRRIIFAMIGACLVIALGVAIACSLGIEQLNLALSDTRASEARFRLFASVATEAIWEWDLETRRLWSNGGLRNILGYVPHELKDGDDFVDRLVPASDRERIRQALGACLQGGTWAGEHHLKRQDGTLAYVLHRAAPVRNPAGRTTRIIGSITDISSRRNSEEKLAEQAALIDQTHDGIVVCDLDSVVRFWNRGAEQLYGWSANEARGQRLDELLNIDPGSFSEASRTVLEQGAWFGDQQRAGRNSAWLTVDCRWTLLRDEEGRPRSILTTDTDITERKQMEAKFLRAQRLESIGTLAGGISHDLNNMLAPIIMGVGMLKQSIRNRDELSLVHCIEQSATRATHLVKQVLSFARGVDGAMVSVHLGYVAREVETMIRSTFPRNITIRFDVPKDLALVMADPTQLDQVLLNLCVNARDAMPQGGLLTVTARNIRLDQPLVERNHDIPPGPYVLLEVADTGTGIPDEIADKIFEPFFTTKAPGKGTGLGLSTVIGIIRSHGGVVNVASEAGKGSVFKIHLPVSSAASPEALPVSTAKPAAGRGELILVADDEASILDVTRRMLESHGYRVLVAADGAEAFAVYHQHQRQIALVLTDMMMPVMDGPALIASLRRLNPHVVVVIASGMNDNPPLDKAAEIQVPHFLNKPYDTQTLLAVIRKALADRPAA